ncbi:MAG TPA: class I SAM-dependent methyltransferase [Candidatus Hydrogenedentes bacterium]|nr:class I SAM-dependent methyltransferase [Candidatus Hydrogenedentota bacterium]
MHLRCFDDEAATWDDKPRRSVLIEDIFNTMKNEIPLRRDMKALDFGCGTGALAMRLAPLVGFITGADISRGMLDVFKGKMVEHHVNNAETLLMEADRYDALTGAYDLIVSSMTLHHIENISPLLKHFLNILAPGGYLAIADLDPDGGLFHGENAGVFHAGFDRETLRRSFLEAGFATTRCVTAAETEKPAADGHTRRFSLFLMIGRRA